MSRKSRIMTVLLLIVISGCTAASPIPIAPTATPTILPTVTPELAAKSMAPPSTVPATLAVTHTPGQQLAYSATLSITAANSAAVSVTLRYWLYLPDGYGEDSQTQWPLILFLHGAAQRGDDIEQVKQLGLPNLVETRLKVPALVLSPQLPSGKYWNDYVGLLEQLLDQITQEYAVDLKRVYVTGFSMGGYGTWALGLSTPERFAALAPVAGGWDAAAPNICSLKAVPIWVIHGANDEMVAPVIAEEMVKALQSCGGNVRYTSLPRTTHSAAATVAYLQPDFIKWLLAQHLP